MTFGFKVPVKFLCPFCRSVFDIFSGEHFYQNTLMSVSVSFGEKPFSNIGISKGMSRENCLEVLLVVN